MSLYLPRTLRSTLETWAREGYPAEVCGILIGSRNENMVRIEDVTLARNLDSERAHDRFELDPQDLVRSDERARGLGLDVVGIWHTHPDHPARPSATDRASARADWVYVIVSVSGGKVADTRAWCLQSGRYVERKVTP
jgi:proteasome lid subunit RPN8/RPN11